jgi:ribose-phosphate pyrophosphokinase
MRNASTRQETDVCLFALDAEFGTQVADALGMALCPHEERRFEDGEHKTRPLVNVRGRDVYVLASLHGDAQMSVNDKLVRLLFFLGALRDAGAAHLTAVVPYLCYARKDRRTQPRDPVSTRYVAGLFESVGTDRIVTLDVHNLAAFENAFRIRTEHLEARLLLVDYFAALLGAEDLVVVSPDVGGVKRADAFRRALEARLARPLGRAFVEKRRSGGVVSGDVLVGDVAGRTAIILDDLISSGTTLGRAIKSCCAQGARRIFAAATHGLFTGRASDLLLEPALAGLVVSDSVGSHRLASIAQCDKLAVIATAPLFAEAIRRIHGGGSVAQLLGN